MVFVAVILIALALIGVYYSLSSSHQKSATGPSSCIAQSGFSCQSSSYSSSSGNLTVTVSQNSGSNWSVATVIFVAQGTPYANGVPLVSWNSGESLNGGLKTGSSDSVVLPASGAVSVGSPLSGTLWAQYQLNAGGTFYYAEIGAVNTTAV